jgi:hypothetical protein
MMAEAENRERVNLDESANPKSADIDTGEFSANPKGAIPELLEKSAQPKAPDGFGKDEASVQPVSTLPDTERDPPPANKG